MSSWFTDALKACMPKIRRDVERAMAERLDRELARHRGNTLNPTGQIRVTATPLPLMTARPRDVRQDQAMKQTSEHGRLQGGPHDGVTFETNDRFWYAPAHDRLPEPAQRVYVTADGRLLFWFTASVTVASTAGPALSRYDLNTDDPGWLYTYVGEQTP